MRLVSLFVLLFASLGACGGDASKPRTSGTAGSGGGGSTGAAGTGPAAGNAGSGAGTAGSTGAGGSTSGAGGSGGVAGVTGTSGASGGAGTGATAGTGGSAGQAGTGGGAGTTGAAGGSGSSKPAIANMVQANGNGVMGTATFTPDAQGFVTLMLTAKNCPGNGAHSFHLRAMADCGNDGMNSGMIWTKGGMLGTITCNGGNGGMAMYKTPSAGYWTIGTGDMNSDILLRSVVIDMGTEAMPGNPIACGVPRND
jgi:hypothetical protein